MNMDNDMARDFGFDISMPDGNVGLPSAAHKLFMEQCKVLYREFMTNMSVHINTEKLLRKSLRSLHEEKLRNMRFSLYRSESADPFARRPEVESSTAFLDSRGNTPWGLDTIPDDEGPAGQRPQTAPAVPCALRKSTVYKEGRPKTAGNSPNDPDDGDSDSGLSDMSVATKSTVMGVVDRKTELGSNRKITVGQNSFTKISHGNVTAKLKHKDGKFVVKPVKVDLDREAATSDTVAYDPSAGKQKFDPVTERLALVRKITDYKTATISSDMKINNRVPIQKCLRGIDAKRTTISEIYQSARDRSARHFRIVTNKPDRKGLHDERQVNGRMVRSDLSNRWAKALRASFCIGSLGRGLNKDNVGAEGHSQENQARPRSILLFSGSGGSKSLGESLSAKEIAQNAFMNMYQDVSKRPQSKVAFARTDSHMSNEVFINDSVDAVANVNKEVNQSHTVTTPTDGTGQDLALKKMLLAPPGGRPRTSSGNSDIELRSRCGSVSRQRTTSDSNTRGVDSSNGTAANNKNKSNTNAQYDANGKKILDRSLAISLDAPSKLESSRDTKKIVKQQMRMDKHLDERMAVWRRRMAVKSTAMTTKLRPSPRRSKLSII